MGRKEVRMSRSIKRATALVALCAMLLGSAALAAAQTAASMATSGGPSESSYVAAPPPNAGLQAPATSGAIQLQTIPVNPQPPPDSSITTRATSQFEHNDTPLAFPQILTHQWSPTHEVPPESLISESYLRTSELKARKMSL
jgi:hypothetical protein